MEWWIDGLMGKLPTGVLMPNNPIIQLSNLPFRAAGPLELLRVQGFEMACRAVTRQVKVGTRVR